MCAEWFLFFSLIAKLNFSLSENCKNKFPARKTSLKQLLIISSYKNTNNSWSENLNWCKNFMPLGGHGPKETQTLHF